MSIHPAKDATQDGIKNSLARRSTSGLSAFNILLCCSLAASNVYSCRENGRFVEGAIIESFNHCAKSQNYSLSSPKDMDSNDMIPFNISNERVPTSAETIVNRKFAFGIFTDTDILDVTTTQLNYRHNYQIKTRFDLLSGKVLENSIDPNASSQAVRQQAQNLRVGLDCALGRP